MIDLSTFLLVGIGGFFIIIFSWSKNFFSNRTITASSVLCTDIFIIDCIFLCLFVLAYKMK